MDMEGIGAAIGMGRVIRQQADAANANMARANAIIEEKNQHLDALADRVAQLEAALAVEKAHSAGLSAQVRMARQVFVKGGAQSLLAKTGMHYGTVAQDAFHVVYERAFDAQAIKGGIKDFKKARAQAV